MSDELIEIEEKHYAPIYWKRPLVITHGEGSILYDLEGRSFIDCTSNYGVAITGHCHPKVVNAIHKQSNKLISCHSSFYNDSRSIFLDKLGKLLPRDLSKAYLGNSGTEAVEFALKLARKYTGKIEFIAMMNGFHGKTMGSLSATWKKKYRQPFVPLIPGFKHVPFGKIDRLRSAITDNTAAVILEPIQGEGGINIPPEGYLKAVRDLCTEKNSLMILDEIQTGVGRTGKFLAAEHNDVQPDILCLAKALASGLPLSATMTTDEIASSLNVGDHSSTFGGGPISCAAGSATLDVLVQDKLIDKASTLGKYMLKELECLYDYKCVREIRGKGMMIAIELRFDALNIITKSMEKGVLFLEAGRNIIRLLPPLVIKKKQVDIVTHVLNDVIKEEEEARFQN